VQDAGDRSRFPGGLPPISDGQMLFLQHLATKMRPVHEAKTGGRAGIVLNGSPLFTGGAGSGPSEIRRWLLEHDLVDAIVALPTNMFYNTGIATYVWILDNTKPADRIGTVQLIDGTGFYSKMRKNLGQKSREVSKKKREEILRLYAEHAEGEHSKIFPTDAFGCWTITVERPLRDDAGEIVRDRKGNAQADAKLRDTENVPFTYGGNERGQDARDAVIQAYFEAEVAPHVPDAWVDGTKTKVGYEIPFTRHFYVYKPPRPLEEIDRELDQLVGEIMALLRDVER
jgi:type I restriction enzyme M protein